MLFKVAINIAVVLSRQDRFEYRYMHRPLFFSTHAYWIRSNQVQMGKEAISFFMDLIKRP